MSWQDKNPWSKIDSEAEKSRESSLRERYGIGKHAGKIRIGVTIKLKALSTLFRKLFGRR